VENAANDKEARFKLTYRPDDDEAGESRADLFSGECYVKSGDGPGAFGGWKKAFVAERSDSNIELYNDEKRFRSKKRPNCTIKLAGYRLVTDVSEHYRQVLKEIADDIGLSDAEITALSTFSRYSWALVHPQRTNYIFQLHPGKNSACSCLPRPVTSTAVVDPDESGAERRDDVVRYVDTLKTCQRRADDRCRDVKELSKIAFRKACEQIPTKIANLENWTDNGTETEMLVEMLMTAILVSVRDDMMHKLKGPASMKLSLWYKSQGALRKTVVSLAEPAWKKMLEEVGKLDDKITGKVRPMIEKVLDIKQNVEKKIEEKIGSKLDSTISQFIVPCIKPFVDVFENPLKTGFDNGRELLATKLNVQTLDQDKTKRNEYLNQLAWSSEFSQQLDMVSGHLVEPLKKLASINTKIFDSDFDPASLQGQAKTAVLTTVDAAVYTIAVRLDTGEPNNEEQLEKLLRDYDHDAILMRCDFVKTVARRILISAFKKITSPVLEPVIGAVNDNIPDQMADFLDVESIVDGLIDKLIGIPVDKVVEATFRSST
jgi:hypothetical protein